MEGGRVEVGLIPIVITLKLILDLVASSFAVRHYKCFADDQLMEYENVHKSA